MTNNSRALPDRTNSILAVDVIVPKVGRRVRRLGTVSETNEGGRRVFNFKLKSGDEIWRFIPSNSIACNAITVDEFSRSLETCGELDALWDEIEGHPVIMISVATPTASEGTPPLFVAKRLMDDAKRRR
jgi:hypothetical protein